VIFLTNVFGLASSFKNKHHQTKTKPYEKVICNRTGCYCHLRFKFCNSCCRHYQSEPKVINKFKAEFSTVDQVEWEVKKDFIKAKFSEDGLTQEAFFTQDGELIGTSKQIDRADMPSVPRKALNKAVEGAELLELIEFNSTEKGVAYYASIQKDGVKRILEISSTGTVSNYKK